MGKQKHARRILQHLTLASVQSPRLKDYQMDFYNIEIPLRHSGFYTTKNNVLGPRKIESVLSWELLSHCCL